MTQLWSTWKFSQSVTNSRAFYHHRYFSKLTTLFQNYENIYNIYYNFQIYLRMSSIFYKNATVFMWFLSGFYWNVWWAFIGFYLSILTWELFMFINNITSFLIWAERIKMAQNYSPKDSDMEICRFCLSLESDNNLTPLLSGFFNEMLTDLHLNIVSNACDYLLNSWLLLGINRTLNIQLFL